MKKKKIDEIKKQRSKEAKEINKKWQEEVKYLQGFEAAKNYYNFAKIVDIKHKKHCKCKDTTLYTHYYCNIYAVLSNYVLTDIEYDKLIDIREVAASKKGSVIGLSGISYTCKECAAGIRSTFTTVSWVIPHFYASCFIADIKLSQRIY